MKKLGPTTADKLIMVASSASHFAGMIEQLDDHIAQSTDVKQTAELITLRNRATAHLAQLRAAKDQITDYIAKGTSND